MSDAEYIAADISAWDEDEVQSDMGALLDDDEADFTLFREPNTVARALRDSNSHWQHIPIDTGTAPRGGAPLASLTDEEILAAPVGLAIHLMQTAANGGMQVIAPQQIPLVDTMVRTNLSYHVRDMHVTGSVASANTTWPLIAGEIPASLFPGVPIDGGPDSVAVRRRTKTVPLAPPSNIISDPVIKAFVMARALIDLQSRPDVGGDARGVLNVIARAWGVAPETMSALADVSLAPTGNLLRYAARADQVMPRIHGAIHDLLCISTGTHASGRLVYGQYAAIDWRRARVMTEATFYMATRTEGYTMLDMKLPDRPGDPRAPPNRPGVIQMRPKPGVVWSADPATFKLYPIRSSPAEHAQQIPMHVTRALAQYDVETRPLKIAAQYNAQMSHSTTVITQQAHATSEEVVRGYEILMGQHSASIARGKNAHRMVRNLVYNALASADAARKIHLREVTANINRAASTLNIVLTPDVYWHLANMFTSVCSAVRSGIAIEATVRNATLGDWWADFKSSLPKELQPEKESTRAWGAGAFWFMANPPTPRWQALMGAIQHAQLRQMTSTDMLIANLPRVRGSPARILAACQARLDAIIRVFGERYMAMVSVADILSDLASEARQVQSMRRAQTAGTFWALRAAACTSMRLVPSTDYTLQGMQVANTFYELAADYNRPWHSVIDAVLHDRSVPRAVKALFRADADPISTLRDLVDPLYVERGMDTCRLFRYVLCPHRLSTDIARTRQEVLQDLTETRDYYTNESVGMMQSIVQHEDLSATDVSVMLAAALGVPTVVPGQLTYWDVIEQMGAAGEAMDDQMQQLPDAVANPIYAGIFANAEDLINRVQITVAAETALVEAATDAVM